MILLQPAHFLSSTWEGIVCTPLPECTWVWVIESYSTGKMGMEQKTTLLFYEKQEIIFEKINYKLLRIKQLSLIIQYRFLLPG